MRSYAHAARARLPRRCRPPTPDLYTSRTLRRRHRSGARRRSLRRTISTPHQPLGRPGARFNRHSPFFIGATGAAGVALTYGLVHLLITAQSILILIGLALFLALGLDPITSWLVDRNLPRWLAVAVVFTVALAFAVGFFAVAIPPLVTQTEQLIDRAPDYLPSSPSRSLPPSTCSSRKPSSPASTAPEPVVTAAVTRPTYWLDSS